MALACRVAQLTGAGEFGDEVGQAAGEVAVAGLQPVVAGADDLAVQIVRRPGWSVVRQIQPVKRAAQARDGGVDDVGLGLRSVLVNDLLDGGRHQARRR
ncbi:hypothetical protein ACFSVJ_22040 [Prauserella oleivorans]